MTDLADKYSQENSRFYKFKCSENYYGATMDNFKDSTNNHFLDFSKDQKHLNEDSDTPCIINFTYLIESVRVTTLDDYNAFFEDDGGY